jgi:hypothetical protein
MSLWLVSIEDGDGMWWTEPVGANTREEAIAVSRKQCPKLPTGYVRIVYDCGQGEEVEEEAPNATVEAVPGVLPPVEGGRV